MPSDDRNIVHSIGTLRNYRFNNSVCMGVRACARAHGSARLALFSSFLLSWCLTSTEARWPIRDGDRVGRGRESDRLDRGNRPKKTGETVDRRQNKEVLRRCPLVIAQRLVHCAIAVSTAVLDRVTKTMSVAPLLTNNLDNSKQKTSNLLSPAPPPYS